MKKITIIYLLGLIVILISCEDNRKGIDKDPILFIPKKITIKPDLDTVEVKANKWIEITDGNTYPYNPNVKDEYNVFSNDTQDTLTAGWIKAVALNDKVEKKYEMKIIILQENNSGKERGYIIHVGNGPSFGSLIVIQPAK